MIRFRFLSFLAAGTLMLAVGSPVAQTQQPPVAQTQQPPEAVGDSLATKQADLAAELPESLRATAAGIELTKAADPPAVQMLLPGFRVRELPVELTNVNNVRFRDDGKLITLGYNGDIHLLSDTDGDGLEDSSELFWKNEGSLRGPIGLLVTPKDYPKGRGVFVPSKGKLSLIVDQDGDDKADEEIIVADGWDEIPQNVDATGIAMDAEGALYFGLGTANYANAYLIDDQGQAHYRLESDRGTVQKVSPDFQTRETVCTGIRFPIAFAFNEAGDLFCTEQEGATWLANGNPFDELLHIQDGRHYGFPPRHPIHNLDVIDEPSTYDFAPQHQSTCGMVFNGIDKQPLFGPDGWRGDALICGESRGKIWRTTLVSGAAGYVADSQLIACLQMLTVDACVAPDGDLVVACHSGPPDWGTGPTGTGKLFRVEMVAPDAPRPANTWAASDREIHIAFDRPLDPSLLTDLAEQIHIEYGEYVRAGDRFEKLTPPYAAVQRQAMEPRFRLTVLGVSVSNDLRTLIVQTEPMTSHVHYAVTLPALEPEIDSPSGTLDQHPQIDVDCAPTGLTVNWAADDGETSWSGWLPHLDWNVAAQLTAQSAAHDRLRAAMHSPGTLTLATKLDLEDVLRPQIQPGSTLDYEWPEEEITLVVHSSHPLALEAEGAKVAQSQLEDGRYECRFSVTGDVAASVSIEARIDVQNDRPLDCTVAMYTAEDDRLRPLPLRRFLLPWVSRTPAGESEPERRELAALQGGDWGRGRRVFHSEAAACFKCHTSHGEGGQIGPDLANLIHRDYDSVMRDIKNPSFAINPDFLGQTILMKDGRVLSGLLRSENGKTFLGDQQGHLTAIDREEIATTRFASESVMPTELTEKLSAAQLRDLMTFLLTPPPQMPLDSPLAAPPVRTQAEVAAVLAGSQPLPEDPRPLQLVLVAGNKDHGPGEHDYPAWQQQWGSLLAAAKNVSIDTAWDFPSDAQIDKADVLIFFQKGSWNDHRQQRIDSFLSRGGGAVYIHWAVNGDDRVDDFARRIGLASRGGSIGYRHGPLKLQVHSTDHPIMRNIDSFQLYDESYWRLTGDPQNVTLFATSFEDGAARPQLWSYEKEGGRVFVSIPGHYNWTFDDPIFRTVLLRGIAWTARQPVDRFNDLVPFGARMSR